MVNKRPLPFLRHSFQTQHLRRCGSAGAPLPFDQNRHHTVLTILPCLPLLLLRVQPQPGPALLETQLYQLFHRHPRHPDPSQTLTADLGRRPSTAQIIRSIRMRPALSPTAGNVDLMPVEDHTMLITTTVLPHGNVLFPHQKLRRSARRHHPVRNPTRHNLPVPVGFMPMSHYRMDGRNVVLLKGGHTSWIIAQGQRHGTIRDHPRLPLLLRRPLLLPMPTSAHSLLDGKCV